MWVVARMLGCATPVPAPVPQVEEAPAVAPALPDPVAEAPAAAPAQAAELVPAPVVERPVRVAPVVAEVVAAPVVADAAVAVVEDAAPAAPAAPPAPAAPAAADYALVPTKNSLFVVVTYQRGTLGSAMAHDHAVVATHYSGTVHWDPADPSACRVAVDVPALALRVDPPGARARAGLEGSAPVEDQPKIEENFNGDRQLDSARFPVLTFRAERCAARPDGKVDVTGPLTVHGVARPTTVAMTITADGATFGARGRFTANHADFGMKPFTAAMGAV
jgi:polyisoprenoid-binding protein YceI